jgi:hypothetical protein
MILKVFILELSPSLTYKDRKSFSLPANMSIGENFWKRDIK